MSIMAVSFRFQTLDIWKRAVDIGDMLLDIADDLEQRKLYRFADQMRGASLSISNNIAEGSGSISDRDFANFLNIARRSAFENANMAIVFERRGLINDVQRDDLLSRLDEECRMISTFAVRLRAKGFATISILLCLAVAVGVLLVSI
jgi:four helix bundle protein